MRIDHHPDLVDRLAAAYALGTLRGGARRRFETLAHRHPALRQAALAWQQRLAGLTELQPEAAPPAHLWPRIQAQWQAERDWGRIAHPPARTRRAEPWRLVRWAGAAAAVVASLSWGLWSHQQASRQAETLAALQQRQADQAQQLADAQARQATLREHADVAVRQLTEAHLNHAETVQRLQAELRDARAVAQVAYLAVLGDEQANAVLLATYDERQQRLRLKRVGRYREAADRSLQLWSIAPGAKPQSLGVLQRDDIATWRTRPGPLGEGRLLAISLEPLGGVPEAGGPTGPVLFKGAVLKAS